MDDNEKQLRLQAAKLDVEHRRYRLTAICWTIIAVTVMGCLTYSCGYNPPDQISTNKELQLRCIEEHGSWNSVTKECNASEKR